MSIVPPMTAVAARGVARRDRMLDGIALLTLMSGVALFLFGRWELASLANGTYTVPAGVSWVSRAEFHDAQADWGLALAAGGLVLVGVATLRHLLRRRAHSS